MSAQQGNIFLTTENLAFSLPLIAVCTTYAYFKYIPLKYGVPILGGLLVIFQISQKLKARKAEKLQNLDESMVKDLVGDDDQASKKKLTKAQKAEQKKKQQLAQRLKAEQKAANNATQDDDDDEDDDALRNFAKGGKAKRK
mmetsp:Transcript_25791/g.36382  ORF Transcript_25791/g.36382 Transcript_25791/m.36382 type:complete len:141 (+) Transcript_25791:138-560(+)